MLWIHAFLFMTLPGSAKTPCPAQSRTGRNPRPAVLGRFDRQHLYADPPHNAGSESSAAQRNFPGRQRSSETSVPPSPARAPSRSASGLCRESASTPSLPYPPVRLKSTQRKLLGSPWVHITLTYSEFCFQITTPAGDYHDALSTQFHQCINILIPR
jgi:hypothetical protein